MFRLIAILLPLALLLAFAPAAPVPKVSTPTEYYFPTKLGTKRVYWVEQFKTDVVELVDDVEMKDGEAIVTVRREPKNTVLPKQEKLSVSAKGIVRIEESGDPIRPPLWLLKLPPGEKWDDEYRGKSTYTVGAVEEVEVPAGKFKAIPVTRHWSQREVFPVLMTDWYAPEVGLVKRELTSGGRAATKLVLKSVTTAEEMEKEVRKLCAVFTDKKQTDRARELAVRELTWNGGPAARWAVPELADLLEEPKISPVLRGAAYSALISLGPRAAPAIPTLLRRLEHLRVLREQLRLLVNLRMLGATTLRLDVLAEMIQHARDPNRRLIRPGQPIKIPDLPMPGVRQRVEPTFVDRLFHVWYWVRPAEAIETEQITICRALQGMGAAATPAVEPLVEWIANVGEYYDLEKAASRAVTEIREAEIRKKVAELKKKR